MLDDPDCMPEEDWYPNDRWHRAYGERPAGRAYFPALTRFIRDRGIISVVEIGVRTGYSMAAMLRGNPNLTYLGIDDDLGTWGGKVQGLTHAEVLRQRYAKGDARFLKMNSHKLTELPQHYDLAYIDGDHTTKGCLQDLALVTPFVTLILVDDYDYLSSVRQAVDTFCAQEGHPMTYLPTFRGWAVIHMLARDD